MAPATLHNYDPYATKTVISSGGANDCAIGPSPRAPAFEEEVWARVKRINEMMANLENQAQENWHVIANIRACCFGQEPEPADGNKSPSEVQPQRTGFCGDLLTALDHIEHNTGYLMLILNMAYTEGERLRGLLFDPERKA